jgi:hypothetical protein
MVTSRLFPPGTIYASAFTPILVAAVSEMLSRPVDRVAELARQRRSMEAARAPYGEEAAALRGAPDFAQGTAAGEELGTVHGNGTGGTPPAVVYSRARSPLLHPKVWIATGLAAFLIAVAVLTLPELIFGGAVASGGRTTYFGGGRSSPTKTTTETTPTTTEPQKTVTETVPAQAPQGTQTTPTQTTPAPAGTQTTPTQTTTTPTDTGTSTTPGGAAVPPTP